MRRVAALALSASTVSAVTPVQKVLTMLSEMAAAGEKEKHAENVAFSTFSQWCGDVSAEKKNSIAQSKVQISELDGVLAKANADADQLGQQVAEQEGQLASFNADKDAAVALRKSEKADFLATQTDYEESIDALGRAQRVLKNQNYDRKQAEAALLQVSSLSKVSSSEKSKLQALLSQPVNPKANAYEFQSNGVITMLENLESKFVDELRQVQKEEANVAHAHNLQMQSLHDQIAAATKARDQAASQRQNKLEVAGKAEGDLADTQEVLAADSRYLSDLQTECDVKSKEFEQRQKLRTEEIAALNQAVEILSGGDVSGNANKHLPALIQKKKVTSFLQMRAASSSVNRLVNFLNKAAKKNHSKHLALLAAKVSENPFGKVTKMIETMIQKLMEEANAEEEQHGWCVTEMTTNKQVRDDKTKESDDLRSEVESLQAEIAEQTQKMKELTAAIDASDKAVASATQQRLAESAKNASTVKDAKAAQEAVAQALTVLKEFYAGAAGATALMQQPSSAAADAPGTWDSSYKGQQGSATGVVGMIEVIQSDFVRLETETSSEEAIAAKEHQQFLDDSADDKAVKEATHSHTAKKRSRNELNLASAKKDLAATEKELKAAQEYHESLKPTCVAAPASYADRKAAREQEIENLKEALTILDQ